MSSGRRGTALGLTLALLLAAASGAEVRQIEAVGAAPLSPDVGHVSPPRDLAVRMALNEAVRRVALDLVPDMEPEEAAEFLPEVLGDEPFDYTTRFRIVEDRGERPALFSEDPEVGFEYVVVVEAHIDADRVERRLVDAGLLVAGRDAGPHRDLWLVIEDLGSFAAYALLRETLIEGVGVRSALPVEMQRGRAVLAVNTAGEPRQLLEALLRAAPPELVVTPIAAQGDALTVRIALEARPAGAEPAAVRGGPGGAAPRD